MMEQSIAILIADLSGYTALTEAHGSIAAADLIDKYIGIVETCLVGDARIHERTGDEMMIVSDSPDSLLATALMIEKKTSNEENFLQVHGGLHYGNVLKRGNSYFGAALNLASRIASKADPGTYWCSEEFIQALSDKSVCKLTSKGYHLFKNISIEKEVFEVSNEEGRSFYIDPVCRMLILNCENAIQHPHEADRYFCSASCLEIYTASYKDAETKQNQH